MNEKTSIVERIKIFFAQLFFGLAIFDVEDVKVWLKAAFVRAIKTMAQTAIATIGTSAVIEAVDWRMVVSATALAGLLSLLTSIAGVPEAKQKIYANHYTATNKNNDNEVPVAIDNKKTFKAACEDFADENTTDVVLHKKE